LNLEEIGCQACGLDFTGTGYGLWCGLVNTVKYFQDTLQVENFLTSCENISFCRRTLIHEDNFSGVL
jgi:hypothetical protein